MGYVPPPLMLSRKEFEKRYKAGARTMKELDPALVKWSAKNDLVFKIYMFSVILFFIVFIFLMILAITK